jgi:RimJ/RimL family protein N-acetyltransferase
MKVQLRIQAVGPHHRHLLMAMYDRFDPLGAALGLPPRTAQARWEWIRGALGHDVNVAAFSPAGDVVGHCFLAVDEPGSAEMAIFVHQGFRRRGVGTALVRAALKHAGAAGFQLVWSVAAADNHAVLRLQENCGFRLAEADSSMVRMEVDLPLAGSARAESKAPAA